MNLNSAALLLMAAKGLSLEDVAEIVRANEMTRDPTAAERQARCRARKQVSRVTSRRDPPNEEDILTPDSTPTPDGVGPAKKSRGTRLPDNWTLPSEWAEWARNRRNWADRDIAEEAEIFANYWQTRTGAGATCRDWFKTWRNWVIKSHRKDGVVKQSFTDAEQIAQLEKMIPTYEQSGRQDYVEQARNRIAELKGERRRYAAPISEIAQGVVNRAA